jgi:phosphoserine aminotransferase
MVFAARFARRRSWAGRQRDQKVPTTMTKSDVLGIPKELLPRDGRFGSGPSKVRSEAVAALCRRADDYLGTSHRQAPVKDVVARLRSGLTEFFSLPGGYEVVFGVGGATLFWDAMAFGLILDSSLHFVFGEFSSKCAAAVELAPHLADPEIVESEPGTHPAFEWSDDADLFALTHNETSTGVAMPVRRPPTNGLVAVDATSAAGGMVVDALDFDAYYFSPQKVFASDGGVWVALLSPAALERIEQISVSGRFVPESLNLWAAVENSRRNQTYNTPGLATLFLMLEQLEWMLGSGGIQWAAARSKRSSDLLYEWAERTSFARPFVQRPEQRSPVVVTIDFVDSVEAKEVAGALRSNGIVDTEPYRKLGRNQLRIGTYPAVEPEDVELLTRCIDYVVEALQARSMNS